MKKTIMLALVVMASASFNLALADKKKKKEKEPKAVATVTENKLTTTADSMSYAAGLYVSQGIDRYLQQEYQVDTAYAKDVVAGFDSAVKNIADPQFKAYMAGGQMARTLFTRIIPSLQDELKGTSDSLNLNLLVEGFRCALSGDSTKMNRQDAFKYFEERIRSDREKASAQYKAENEKWLANNKTREGVVTTASGLQYKILTKGTGAIPTATDQVTVKYEGKMIDGTVFDSSYKRNPPTTEFGVNQVIKGWTEALCLMPVGSKWELYIPANLAYGSQTTGPIKGNSTLIFTVELVSIKAKETKK